MSDEYAECEFCGWCTTPGACIWSIRCPECGAPPGIGLALGQCREGARYVKLHTARWEAWHGSRD